MFGGIGQTLKGAAGGLFGDTPGVPSYETLKRRREIADMLMQRTLATNANSVGGGLGQLANALAYRMMDRKLAPQEQGERDKIRDILAGMGGGSSGGFNGGFTGGGTASPGGPVSTTPLGPVEGAMPSGDMAASLRQEMTARGLPEHVADGFLMNFADESGLNPGINEQNPTVPGSRGGFGLAQWTGPRRVALENYAQQSGRPVDDPKLQIEFLVSELQGPESKAAQAIMGTKDAGSAAATIAKTFLRPAEEHLNRRVAEYTGGGGMDFSGMIGSSGPDMAQVSQLAEVLSNPYASEGQRTVAQAMIERQMKGGDGITPYQAAQLGLDQQRLGLERERIERDSRGEYGLSPVWGTDAQGNPALIQLGRDGQPIQTPMPEGFQVANKPIEIDAGTHTILLDPQTRQPIAQIPKNVGAAAAEKAAGTAQGEAAAALGGQEVAVQSALDQIGRISQDPNLPSITGAIQGRLPPLSQGGTDLNEQIIGLESKTFAAAIEALRGLGAMTEQEGQAATKSLGNLSRRQGTEAMQAELQRLGALLQQKLEVARQKASGAMLPADPAAPPAIGGPSDADLFSKYGIQ